ncbi:MULTISPECIES: YfiR family protein [unclassified Pseudoalteromonas]|uniref:YfiR family protein n=1 Tax=unclassified Pseudoalteromonas TaxID=194690 RepID=UPI002097CF5C|nr:YfiR family protein [Pseudoalteromonas sp. XMcav2-N]MCO7187435.1 YfiR family protein [Pseudoalteromonas sp. XMcav2-N]
MIKHLVALCLLIFACEGKAQSLSENELKAAFLYRFSQFSKWPPPPPNKLRFCVVGNSELYQAVTSLLHTQDMDDDTEVMELPNNEQISRCDILFLSQQNRQQTQYWLEDLEHSPVLVVSDTSEGFRQGAMIGLIADANNLSFRVNLTDAKRRGLNFSAHLLKLATEVR